MNRQFKDIEVDERNGKIPLMIFNSVVTRDGQKNDIKHAAGELFDETHPGHFRRLHQWSLMR